jgi:non-lysosomal glucosylceramidase
MIVNRRDFLRTMGLAVGGGVWISMCARTDADVVDGYKRLVPADKGLSPAWVKSLTARGVPTVYTDSKALERIGMPVGGLFTGTLYLGGDGRLWYWDVFNLDREGIVPRQVPYKGRNLRMRDGANYVSPAPRTHPFAQNFGVRIDGKLRTLDSDGFSSVSFKGQYPIGEVTYSDDGCPVTTTLEAYSPFIPLNTPDSSLPATVMSYTLKNTGTKPVTVDMVGWMANPICLHHRTLVGQRRNTIMKGDGVTMLRCSAEATQAKVADPRPDILYENFEKETYGEWTTDGRAFGSGPVKIKDIPDYQGDVGGEGERVVNSHASAPDTDLLRKDGHTGTLTSPEFTIERKYIRMLIGGGGHKRKTCVNLLIDGNVEQSLTGDSNNRMRRKAFSVAHLEGKKARIQAADNVSGGWGNIGVDHIVFTDVQQTSDKLEDLHDFGTMALALIGEGETAASASIPEDGKIGPPVPSASAPLSGEVQGGVSRRVTLEAGQSATVDFVITWHFPNLSVAKMRSVGREYASRFSSAEAVARYVGEHFERLSTTTRLWRDTWYDSTVPYWFLDRTMANTSIMATTTCYRFENGRFWAWEGIGCCHGTCTHVWHYAQAPGRLFPAVERRHREEVDLGIAYKPDGGIGHRADLRGAAHPAHDGQCGRILGCYREHQMTPDGEFLKRNWPKIKQAIQYLINLDKNGDGIIEGAQPNTLDAAWYGRISFLASLYLATLRAGEAMATEMGDAQFAVTCKAIAEHGAETILELYNGEYFYQELDPKHTNVIGCGTGCYIDQVFGQFWAHQLGLGRLFDEAKQRSALRALYKYNFVPHIGRFRDTFERGRWYANEDDRGLLMCSWPKGGLNPAWHKSWQFGYFNECMSGFEWQAAAHMISEGLVTEGLAVSRAIHDRYDAARRNPYNEIECSDHYARAMASYGAFLAACGFEYHGPKGHIGFAPRIHPEQFKAPFTTAEGWGTYGQRAEDGGLKAELVLKWGRLRLRTVSLAVPGASKVAVSLGGQDVAATMEQRDGKALVRWGGELQLKAGQTLSILLS